jgi:DnaJ-class molecular chaperone
MYTETCSHCWGVGTIKNRSHWTLKIEKTICNKCKGKGVMQYKLSPERREYIKKRNAKNRVVISVRWTPPEKVAEEYTL